MGQKQLSRLAFKSFLGVLLLGWSQGEVCWKRWAVGLEPWGAGACGGQRRAAGPSGCGQQGSEP